MIYVDPISGDDLNAGTDVAPVLTLAKALELCFPGASISGGWVTGTFDAGWFPAEIRIIRGVVDYTGNIFLNPTNNYTNYMRLTISGSNDAAIRWLGGSNPWGDHFTTIYGIVDQSIYIRRPRMTFKNLTIVNESGTVRDFAWMQLNNGTTPSPPNWGHVMLEMFNCSLRKWNKVAACLAGVASPSEGGGIWLNYNTLSDDLGTPINNYVSGTGPGIGFYDGGRNAIAGAGETLVVNNVGVATPAAAASGKGACLPMPDGYYGVPLPLTEWVNDTSYLDGLIDTTGGVVAVDPGYTKGRALSPVYHYPGGILAQASHMDVSEDLSGGSGYAEVVDSTPGDAARTVEVRYSNTPFAQLDPTPSWQTINRNSSGININGNYIQWRVTLISNGVI